MGCGPLAELLKDKIKTFRKHVKQFDKAVSPKTKKSRLSILAIEKDEVEDILLLIDDKLAKAEAAGSDEPATEWV